MIVHYFLYGLALILTCNAQFTFEQGVFSVTTTSISSLTTDSATTLTLTGPAATVTVAVPIWHCTASCENDNYGIIVIPPVATGVQGFIPPPAGYPVSLVVQLY